MKSIIFSLLLVGAACGQVPNVYHLDRVGVVDLHPAKTDLGTGVAYAAFPFSRIDPLQGEASLSGVTLPLLTAVTGDNTAAQSINIPSTVGFGPYDFVIIDGGLSTQEMVQISVVDATHLSGTFIANHILGAPVRKVFSGFTKFLDIQLGALPVGGVNNLHFIRNTALSGSIFDMYKINSVVGGTCTRTEDSSMPDLYWASLTGATAVYPPVPLNATPSALTNPSNGVDLGSAGPYTGGSPIIACVQIAVMFTSAPEPPVSLDYRLYWDN